MVKDWQKAFEAAYEAWNGVPCEVKHVGGGWYEIVVENPSPYSVGSRHKKEEMLGMTERLEGRVKEREESKK